MERGKSRWALYTDKTDVYQNGRDGSECALPFAVKRSTSVKCDVCAKVFAAPRSDAKYCSSPCRQKAYRKRVTAKFPIVRGFCEG